MPPLDKIVYKIEEFKGLWYRGDNFIVGDQRYEEIPDGYNRDCHNVIFSNHGVQNRLSWTVFSDITPIPHEMHNASTGHLLLDPNGDLYFDDVLLQAAYIPLDPDEFSISVLNIPGHLLNDTPTKYLVGSGVLKIAELGSVVSIRNACGIAPATAPTAATGAAGRVELGLHLISVVFETDSGFITQWGLPAQYVSPGSVQVNLTVIPLGPAGTVARHIVSTKAIRNFNGDVNAYEYFFVPGGTIANNVATTLTVNFYDTELVSSADYLLDIEDSITGFRILGTYAGRAVYATDRNYYLAGLVVSEVGQYETINLVDNVLNVNSVITAWEYGGMLYVNTAFGTVGFRDNGGPANTWESAFIDNSVIAFNTHSITRTIDGKAGLVDGSVLVLAETGLYAFTGDYKKPALSYNIDGFYKLYMLESIARMQINTTTRSLIIVGADPGTGLNHILMYMDFTFGLDSVRWATWDTPWGINRCPPLISPNISFQIGAFGGNIYQIGSGQNQDENINSGVMVRTPIVGYITSSLIRPTEDYDIIQLSDVKVVSRIDPANPANSYGVSLFLDQVPTRTYTHTTGDSVIQVYNFKKKFQRDFITWFFSTQNSGLFGYKTIELLGLTLYMSVEGNAQIKSIKKMNVPILSEPAITSLVNNKDIDPNIVKALTALSTDVSTLKNSLYGLSRDQNNSLVVNNAPYRNKVGDQKVLEITRDGVLNLGQHYGTRPDVMGNVKGSFYAVPQWGKWIQGSTLAGNGTFVWDIEAFNNTYDLYRREVGNTRIRIIVPGDYLAIAQVTLYNIGALPAGTFVAVQIFRNTVTQKLNAYTLNAVSNKALESMVVMAHIQTTVDTDFVQASLFSSTGAAGRYGGADPYTTLEICKLN